MCVVCPVPVNFWFLFQFRFHFRFGLRAGMLKEVLQVQHTHHTHLDLPWFAFWLIAQSRKFCIRRKFRVCFFYIIIFVAQSFCLACKKIENKNKAHFRLLQATERAAEEERNRERERESGRGRQRHGEQMTYDTRFYIQLNSIEAVGAVGQELSKKRRRRWWRRSSRGWRAENWPMQRVC